MSPAKWRPCCLGHNVLIIEYIFRSTHSANSHTHYTQMHRYSDTHAETSRCNTSHLKGIWKLLTGHIYIQVNIHKVLVEHCSSVAISEGIISSLRWAAGITKTRRPDYASWRLQISWGLLDARPSTATILIRLRLLDMIIHINHTTEHTYCITECNKQWGMS